MLEDIIQFLSFADPNVRFVVSGTMLLGAGAALTGVFSFLRKRSLVGDAIAHSILPGVCLAFILSGSKNPIWLLVGAIISGWISLILIDVITRYSKIKSDTAIGLILSVFFGFGILLLTSIQHSGNAAQSGLDKFLFGKAASMQPNDVMLFGIVTIVLILTVILFFKEFKLLAFNPDYAAAIGLPVRFLELLLSTITVLAVATGIQAVGVVLMAALLITPAAGARFWTHNLILMSILAMVFGAFSGLAGSMISFIYPSMPTGPWIVIALSFITVVSLFFAPDRGIVSKVLLQSRNKKKILRENILKRFYHLTENSSGSREFYATNEIAKFLGFNPGLVKNMLFKLKSQGLLISDGRKWKLTESGSKAGAGIVRLHRLWELYLNQKLNLPADHVHNDAEAIEHVITPELEDMLEQELNNPIYDPHSKIIPNKTRSI